MAEYATEHAWASDHVAVYLAGGLATDERRRMQEHAASCAECAAELEATTRWDREMRALFAKAAPPVTLEDRTIRAVRSRNAEAPRGAFWSRGTRIAAVAASLLFVAALGAAALPTLSAPGDGGLTYFGLIHGNITHGRNVEGKEASARSLFGSDIIGGTNLTYSIDLLNKGRVLSELNDADAQRSGRLLDRLAPLDGAAVEEGFRRWGDGEAKTETREKPVTRAGEAGLAYGGSATGGGGGMGADGMVPIGSGVRLEGRPELPSQPKSTKGDAWFVAPQGAKPPTSQTPLSLATPAPTAAPVAPVMTYDLERQAGAPVPGGGPSVFGRDTKHNLKLGDEATKFKMKLETSGGDKRGLRALDDVTFFRPEEEAKKMSSVDKKSAKREDDLLKRTEKLAAEFDSDRKPSDGKETKDLQDLQLAAQEKLGDKAIDKAPGKSDPKNEPKVDSPKPATNPTTPAQAPIRKIIIRTGTIEFEIDSFDAAVSGIFALVGKTNGAFVATVNSEKLSNGKMRGDVVVRMPPEVLDQFVLDLRSLLAKTGELKGQRIGSQDVTKLYTDLEGELKAARTMEERFLGIIRENKGQLKDVLAVEKELSIWRTKIEKLEGELRYYSNMASLSTLTLQLVEKEIRVAASLTEVERVQAGLEVDDVEKAYQDAQAAIHEVKGRISRAEMKQHAAGQFNAILVFETAPEASGQIRDRLRQLGNMVRLEIDRVQRVDGSGVATKDGKVKRGDTQFTVSLYNLANVAPRETFTLTLVADDVPAAYSKLRDAVIVHKGVVRNAQLLEQNKANVTGQVDFDVRRIEEPKLQLAFKEIGEILGRRADRRQDAENVTDSKVMFLVRILPSTVLVPKETSHQTISVAEVAVAYKKIQDAIAKAKGMIVNAGIQQGATPSATLEFDVRRADEAAVNAALAGVGESVSSRVERQPDGETVTETKIRFNVRCISENLIMPRETLRISVAADDVPAVYHKLRDLVLEAKGRIRNANLQEVDRQNVSAVLEVELRRGDDAKFAAAAADAGELLSRTAERQQPTENTTDAKVAIALDLRAAGTIAPRKTHTLAVEVTKVDDVIKALGAAVAEGKGRVADGPQIQDPRSGQVVGKVIYDVPLATSAGIVEQIKNTGKVRAQDVIENHKAPSGKLAMARISLTLTSGGPLLANDDGVSSQFRQGLQLSLRGLILTGSYLVAALIFLVPWLLILWILFAVVRRFRGKSDPAPDARPAA